MFQTKVCGITTVSDCRVCIDAQVQAIGLNFFPSSSRFLDPNHSVAAEIRETARDKLSCVGLWVNADISDIADIVGSLNLDFIQLHGDEDPAYIKRLADLVGDTGIIKAFRIGRDDAASIVDFIGACEIFGVQLAGILVDAFDAENYGGTGNTLDWQSVRLLNPLIEGYPLLLAGGLDESNVGEAITSAKPHGVDVASGVESSPGRKDSVQVSAFVENAMKAFEACG